MSIPAIAALMRASSFPNVASAGARFFEGLAALLTEGPAVALDVELKAVLDEDGNDVFPAGTATTEAAAQKIFEERPQFLQEFGTLVTRYISGAASELAGLVELRVIVTAAQIRAFGANASGLVALGNQPAKASVRRAYVLNLNQELTGLVTLVSRVGHVGNDDSLLVDATGFAANAANETIPVTPVTSYTAVTALTMTLAAGANLDQLDAGIVDATELLEIVVELSL